MKHICPTCGKIVSHGHICPNRNKDNRRGRVLSENSTKWKKLKKDVKERDLCCKLCWYKGVYSPIEECHHIIPKEVNEESVWDPSNVIGLCHECHRNVVHKSNSSWKEYVNLLQQLIREEK